MQEYCLSRQNLYMLPTRHGVIFSVILLAMLLVAVNYNNSLAYIMTFTLASTVLVSMLYTHRNLQGVCISYGISDSVFSGSLLSYTVILMNHVKRDRYDIGIDIQGDQSRRCDIASGSSISLECTTRANRRGWQQLPEVQVNTRYPLGLLFSWSKPAGGGKKVLVYPEPGEWQEFPRRFSGYSSKPVQRQVSHDDFSGLRKFRPGDPPQHMDWKTFARGKGLYSKEFIGGELPEISFQWDDTHGEKEARISLLTRWVIEASTMGLNYGLEIPGQVMAPSNSEQHLSRCLRALALF